MNDPKISQENKAENVRQAVPWSGPGVLDQALQSIRKTHESNPAGFESASGLAKAIRDLYGSLDAPLSELCAATCPSCTDVCCVRASIWYDFKDLVYLYFSRNRFPEHQICKIQAGGDSPVCSHLTASGCRLPRFERPFVCTWYLCPSQTAVLAARDDMLKERIGSRLAEIKELRTELETLFVSVSGGRVSIQGRI